MEMERPTVRRKEREKEARRESILCAAARVFSRKGYYEATLDEIATEAELAKGTLYNYYTDKQDLFASLMVQSYGEFSAIIVHAAQERHSLNEFLVHIFSDALSGMIAEQRLYRLMLAADAALPNELYRKHMEVFREQVLAIGKKLAEALATIPECSHLPSDDIATGAKMILTSLRYMFIIAVDEAEGKLPTVEIENFARLITRALTVEPIR